jgi:[acyl-carrier-protein] S-malonyltransferase
MGQDAYQSHPAARAVFDEADALLGFPLTKLCFTGNEGDLHDTANTQPAVFVTSVALWSAVSHRLRDRPLFFAGHSLGEYAALVASGALDFATGLRLVRERGRLMQAAGEACRGGMAAVLGLEASVVETICGQAEEETGGVVQVANYNCPGQTVISGDESALVEAMERAMQAKARKVVRLAVSIAAHSPLMLQAVAPFRAVVDAASVRPPVVDVISNVTARPLTDARSVATDLVQQLTAPVQWMESVLWMAARGADTLVEVGPGEVLTGLTKRIDRGLKRVSVRNGAGIQALVGGDRQ